MAQLRNFSIKKISFIVILNLIFSMIFVSCFFAGNFDFLENKVLELAIRLRGQITPSHVVIVEIDDKSMEAMGRWPWSRDIFADLLEHVDQKHPRAIGANIFISNSGLETDSDLAIENTKLKSVVINRNIVVLDTNQLNQGTSTAYPQNFAQLPAGKFAHSLFIRNQRNEAIGIHVNQIDPPSVSRTPPFALALASLADSSIGRDLVKNETQILMNFVGPGNTVPRVSAIDVLRGNIQVNFSDKVVIIGTFVKSMAAEDQTILGPMNTAEIHANIVEAILSHNYLVKNLVMSVAIIAMLGIGFFLSLSNAKIALLGATIFTYFLFYYASFLFLALLMPITPLFLILGINAFVYWGFGSKRFGSKTMCL